MEIFMEKVGWTCEESTQWYTKNTTTITAPELAGGAVQISAWKLEFIYPQRILPIEKFLLKLPYADYID